MPDSNARVQIAVACIGLAGVIAAAFLSNYDKIVGHTDPKPAVVNSRTPSGSASPEPGSAAAPQPKPDTSPSAAAPAPAASQVVAPQAVVPTEIKPAESQATVPAVQTAPDSGLLNETGHATAGGAKTVYRKTANGAAPVPNDSGAPVVDPAYGTKKVARSVGSPRVAVPDSAFYSLPDNVMVTTASPGIGTPLSANTTIVFNVTLHYRLTSLKQAALNLRVNEHSNDGTCSSMGLVAAGTTVPIFEGERDVTVSVPYRIPFDNGSMNYGAVIYSNFRDNQVLKVFGHLPGSCYPFAR